MTRSKRIARIRSSATFSAPTAASATNNAKTPINNAKANAKTLKATPLPAGSTADSLEKMMNYTKAELKRLLRAAWGEVATRRNEILTLRAVVTNLRQDLAHNQSTGLPKSSSSISSGPLMTTFTVDSNNNTHNNNNNNINIVNNRNSLTPRARHPQHTNEDPYFFLSTNTSRMVSPTPAAGHMPPAGANGLVTPTPMSMQDQHYQQRYQQRPQEQKQGTAASVTTTATTTMMMGDMDMMDGRGMEGGEEEVDSLLEALLAEQGGVDGVGEKGGLMAEFVVHWGASEGKDGKEEGKPAGMVEMSVVVNE